MEDVLDQVDWIVGAHLEQAVAKMFLLLGPLYKATGVEVPGTMKITWTDPEGNEERKDG